MRACVLSAVSVCRICLVRPFFQPSPKKMSQHLPSFYTDELTRALEEAAFGIHSYDVLPPIAVQDVSQNSQAVARVTLLEGMTIYLRLSIAGYQVRRSPDVIPTRTAPVHVFSLLIAITITRLSPIQRMLETQAHRSSRSSSRSTQCSEYSPLST